ncbi:ABC transporter ATP-binding protein [Dielma fastidiosa]|uniref:ABC transporter ATP-binding protein n=1 Tax=Dielma fastidiosa TaxID=1034346 RepID=UPI000EC05463|nr:ABC transporter ATP-binding protein [Dielma fastidiosa]HAH94930.1 ABC transporter ATP-binding protein [Dielma fastidiosa]
MIRFENASIGYHEPILKALNLTIKKGGIHVIVGPNGCGKTTMMKGILTPSMVSEGKVLLAERELNTYTLNERAKCFAYLPQTRPIPHIHGKTLVGHGRYPYQGFLRSSTQQDRSIVDQVMAQTQTTHFAHEYVDELSGGQRQRVFLAMALAQNCEWLLLDEPTTYLDFTSQLEVMQLIKTLKEQGKTILLTLHDLSQALQLADELIVMNDGRIEAQGSVDQILADHLLERVFHIRIKIFNENGKRYPFIEAEV